MQNEIKVIQSFGRLNNWVDGTLIASSSAATEDVFTPYTGQVIAQVPVGNAQDVEMAIGAAKEAFPAWRDTHIKDRVQVMFRLKNILEKNMDELANLVALENGKTLGEARASIAKGIEVTEFGCAIPNKISGLFQEVSKDVVCRFTREPLGVVASITPFNFPVMVPLWTIPIILTVGNTMVLKPSEQVPLSALRLAEYLREAGLPKGVFNVVNGKKEVVAALCEHPDLQALSFVGSTKIAKLVYAKAAASGKRVLALGGAKNHLVLVPDADMDYTPQQIVDSAIGCAGQRCMAASVLIAVGNCSEYIEKMKAYAASVQVGTGMGAIINKPSVERITRYIDGAEKSGGRVVVDGRGAKPKNFIAESDNGYWVGPTLIDEVAPHTPLACEEIFGPVLSIIHVDSIDEAVEIENKNPYGNAASIFTSNGALAEYWAKHANAGMCGVNIGVPVPREPFAFGGWNESKFGVGDITGNSGIAFWTKDKKLTTKWINPKNRDWMS
jgi:malonate-semialdehyde dehydrogenase (acetylating)/methylmalonate-semialdehyde dehydrogenase